MVSELRIIRKQTVGDSPQVTWQALQQPVNSLKSRETVVVMMSGREWWVANAVLRSGYKRQGADTCSVLGNARKGLWLLPLKRRMRTSAAATICMAMLQLRRLQCPTTLRQARRTRLRRTCRRRRRRRHAPQTVETLVLRQGAAIHPLAAVPLGRSHRDGSVVVAQAPGVESGGSGVRVCLAVRHSRHRLRR